MAKKLNAYEKHIQHIIAVLGEDILDQMPLDRRLQGLSAGQRLQGLSAEARTNLLAEMGPTDLAHALQALPPETRAELVQQLLAAENGTDK